MLAWPVWIVRPTWRPSFAGTSANRSIKHLGEFGRQLKQQQLTYIFTIFNPTRPGAAVVSQSPWGGAIRYGSATTLNACRNGPTRKEELMKILMVLTSHDKLGNTGRKTGFWLEELAAPYYVFKDAGAQIILASPKGGRPAARSKEQRAELPDRHHPSVREGCRRQRRARQDSAPR